MRRAVGEHGAQGDCMTSTDSPLSGGLARPWTGRESLSYIVEEEIFSVTTRFAFSLLFLAWGMTALAVEENPPTLAIGAPAPDFALAGVDGRTHSLADFAASKVLRSEEHTSELQSRRDLVCRLLLEKKKQTESAAAR